MIRSALVILLLTLISVGFATVIALLTDKAKAVRWPAALVAGGVLLAGWLFIFWQNSFHVTTPVVIVALGYVAVVSTVFNLWRTGAAAVAPTDEDEGDASWGLPIGARGELEREKKTLLKAIKEAEFDLAMGKLSKVDAESMIKTFRVRAIEVIKEIEKLDAGAAGSVRERIEREVRARIELEAAVDKKAAAAVAAKQAKKDKKKQRGGDKKAEEAESTAEKSESKSEKADTDDKVDTKAEKVDAKAEKVDAKTEKAEKAATAVDAADAKPVDAAALAASPETAADVAASSDGPAAATTEVATETAASAAEIASVVETPAAAERAAVAEAVAEAATGDTKKKDESSKNESSKNESKDEPAKADKSSKKPGAKEAAS